MKINNETEAGERKIAEFIDDLLERNKVDESEREEERARLEDMVEQKIMDEILMSLSDDNIEELGRGLDGDDDALTEKILTKMSEEGIRPESVVGKVFKEIEREYLGVENVESDEALNEVGEEE